MSTNERTPTAPKTYRGSCHCQNVRFEVTADIGATASACNCSICNRVGWLMISVPTEAFTLLAGDDAQIDYQFGKKTMHHPFCKTCGIHAFGRWKSEGDEKVIVNLRCLEDIDVATLRVETFDGKSY